VCLGSLHADLLIVILWLKDWQMFIIWISGIKCIIVYVGITSCLMLAVVPFK